MTEQFKIEKDVPIPGKSVGRRCKYPFKDMEVGDSVLLPMQIKQVHSRLYHCRHQLGFKFTARSSEGGVRCWRIA